MAVVTAGDGGIVDSFQSSLNGVWYGRDSIDVSDDVGTYALKSLTWRETPGLWVLTTENARANLSVNDAIRSFLPSCGLRLASVFFFTAPPRCQGRSTERLAIHFMRHRTGLFNSKDHAAFQKQKPPLNSGTWKVSAGISCSFLNTCVNRRSKLHMGLSRPTLSSTTRP